MSLSLTKKAILAGYAHSISLKGFEANRLFLVTPLASSAVFLCLMKKQTI